MTISYRPVHPWFWKKVYDYDFYRRMVKLCAREAEKAIKPILRTASRRLHDGRSDPLVVLVECEGRLEALIDEHPEAGMVAHEVSGLLEKALWLATSCFGVTFIQHEDGTGTLTWPAGYQQHLFRLACVNELLRVDELWLQRG